MWVSPYSQLFYFIERLEICDFFNERSFHLFSLPPLLIFTKDVNISGGHCVYGHRLIKVGLDMLASH